MMTIQFVPSDCNNAYLPVTTANMAVPAVVLAIGTTFDEALMTLFAVILVTCNICPE